MVGTGVFLWVAGGRSAELVIRSLLDRRLYLTPISPERRGRWLRIEEWAVPAACLSLALMAVVRLV